MMETLNYEYPLDRDPRNKIIDDAINRERSPTWKERHAKGVPVKMTYDDMDQCKDGPGAMYGISAETLHEAYVTGGKPYVLITSDNTDAVSLRNFRYKQSWLDKKGGDRG